MFGDEPGTAQSSSSITPVTAAFDKYSPSAIGVAVNYNGNTLTAIKNGTVNLVSGTNYTVSGNNITLATSYLSSLPVGTTTLTFDFNAGYDPKLVITVTDSTPSASLSISQAEFDKNVPSNIAVGLTLNGHTLTAIKNGTTTLTSGTHYTVSGTQVTLLSSYLTTQPLGNTTLTFDFSGGIDPTLVVKIKDSSIVVTGNLKIQMFNGNTQTSTNGIAPRIKLYNTGTTSINLSDVKLRYYYTVDTEKAQSFWCDWSSAGSDNVTGTFVKLATAKTGADYYLEVGFTSGAGTLAAGQSIEVQTRFSKTDWTNYSQSNDYSFNATGSSYVDWTNMTGYLAGSLVWGVEP
ncbi:MAG: X2-like carbohydrate binding domain-containing protein [Mobilitalea sp.]